MLRYMLDTNIVTHVIKSKPMSALQLFNEHAGHMAISAITLAELLHGAEKSHAPARSLAVVEDFFAPEARV
jgi:tRNA(fMet)-specific endonuclease VapC